MSKKRKTKPEIHREVLNKFALSQGVELLKTESPYQAAARGLETLGYKRFSDRNEKDFCIAFKSVIAAKAQGREPRQRSLYGHIASDAFLESYEWRRVRMEALKFHGPKCQCCGATPETGAVMNVDHIKPRRLFPQLALDLDNLQILCHECNHGKGNWDTTDWRKSAPEFLTDEQEAHIRAILKG